MPVINTQGYAAIASVRVQVDWSDVPAATYATVWRVDCTTGARTQLRPYVAYNANGYLLLSCGVATFWDTEVPLDTCVYYCTQAQDTSAATISTAASLVISDDFNRVNANTWNTSTSGHLWFNGGGVAADFNVNGAQGTHTLSTANVSRRSGINGDKYNIGAKVTVSTSAVATGAAINQGITLRRIDSTGEGYNYMIRYNTGGTADLLVQTIVAGTVTTISTTVLGLPYAAGTLFDIRAEVSGSTVRAKLWNTTTIEPSAWTVTLTNTAVPAAGFVSLRSISDAGNTNVNPILSFDNFSVYDLCEATQTVEVCSGNVTVASNGNLWLKDPVRPCNDQQITLCWTPDPNCVDAQGIFFARLEAESYPSNTNMLQPINARRPIPVVRQRADADSTLVLVTRSFTDRDDLLTELEPGSPLLLQTPVAYGMPDRYVSVGDVSVTRYQPDHRYEPRVFSLPFTTVDRPAGPSQGICGARVDDLCDTYSSWSALIAAGLTFQNLLDGKASPDGPGVNFRTWLQVESTYATWLAVETAPNTWETVREI